MATTEEMATLQPSMQRRCLPKEGKWAAISLHISSVQPHSLVRYGELIQTRPRGKAELRCKDVLKRQKKKNDVATKTWETATRE